MFCNNLSFQEKEIMLYIIRHGRTDWNRIHKLQGRTDVPLNEEGRKMAEDARLRYENVHFDVCYCSPLSRAKETAQILLRGRNVPVFYDERLIEMSFGNYEGTENCLEKGKDTPLGILFFNPGEFKGLEGGESFDQLFERTGSFLKEVALPLVKQGKDVLIVGHGAMNSSIVCQIMNKPRSEFWSLSIKNCELHKLI